MELKTVQIDTTKATKGIWRDWLDGSRLKIARMNNPNYDEQVRELARGRYTLLSFEEQDQVAVKAEAAAILLDWEGIDEGGQPVAYSHEAAERLLREYDVLRNFVLSQSRTDELYFVQQQEAAIKN